MRQYLLVSFQIANRTNMYAALSGICSEQLGFQVHQGDLIVALLIYDYLAVEILGQVKEHLLLTQAVREEEDAVLKVGSDDVDQALVSFFS